MIFECERLRLCLCVCVGWVGGWVGVLPALALFVFEYMELDADRRAVFRVVCVCARVCVRYRRSRSSALLSFENQILDTILV